MEIVNSDVSSVSGMDASFLSGIEETLQDFVYGKDGSGGLMAYFSSIAIAISLIFFLISILQLVTEDRFTPEFLVKFFAKFVISFCVIIWSPYILKAIIEFGVDFSKMAGDAASEAAGKAGGVADEAFDVAGLETLIKNHEAYYYTDVTWTGYPTAGAIANGIKQGGAPWSWHEVLRSAASIIISPINALNVVSKKLGSMGQIGPALGLSMEMVTLMLFRLISLAITAIVIFIVLTRIMELYVRGSFLPIAAAMMSDDGWKGSGGRYFRKLLSLASQNAAVLVIANIFGVMSNSAMKKIFVSAITAQTHLKDSSGKIVAGCTEVHNTLADIAVCKACLNEIPAPINLPILKPMIICIIICVAGIAMMFKAASLMDDIWGAR